MAHNKINNKEYFVKSDHASKQMRAKLLIDTSAKSSSSSSNNL